MKNERKNFLEIFTKGCAAIGILSLLIFLPIIREMIISVGEHFCGRGLTHSVWHTRFIKWEFEFFFCDAFLSVCIFTFKKGFPKFLLLLLIFFSVQKLSLVSTAHFGDYRGQWTLCAYTLRGVNPFTIVGSKIATISKIGTVPNHFGTTPWGLVLGNLFYPGFLSTDDGKPFFILLHFILILLVTVTVFKKLKIHEDLKLMLVTVILVSPTYWTSLFRGNCSGLLYALLFLVIFWHREFPILTGVALAFAMIKPQSAGLICLTLLLERKFRTIIVAAVIDFLAWGVAALLTETAPIQLLRDFFAINIGEQNFKGISTIFLYSFPENISLALSMILGIAFTITFYFLLKNKKSPLITFFPACVATTFWCYAYSYDRFLLSIPVILCLTFLTESTSKIKQFLYFLASLCLQVGGDFFDMKAPIMNKIHKIIQFFVSAKKMPTWWISTSLHEFLLIAISIIILIKLNRNFLNGNDYSIPLNEKKNETNSSCI